MAVSYDQRFNDWIRDRDYLDWIEYLDVKMHDGYSSMYTGPVKRVFSGRDYV